MDEWAKVAIQAGGMGVLAGVIVYSVNLFVALEEERFKMETERRALVAQADVEGRKLQAQLIEVLIQQCGVRK